MRQIIQRGLEMRKVKAETAKVLETIKKNYEAHKAAYAEACDGYKIEAAELLEETKKKVVRAIKELEDRVQKADLKKGPVELTLPHNLLAFNHRPPQNHAASYEVVIRMLEFETEKFIEIDTAQFECYVMDRWDWKDEFASQHETYSNKLATSNARR